MQDVWWPNTPGVRRLCPWRPPWRCWAAAWAGCRAAHELAERGFAVTVYEKRARPGGKARSYPDARRLAGRARVPVLPRLLPAPAGHDGADPVGRRRPRATGSSAPSGSCSRAADGENELLAPAHAPESLADLRRAGAVRVRRRDPARRARGRTSRGCSSGCSRCWRAATSGAWGSGTSRAGGPTCRRTSAREAFRRYLADGLTRTLVAARAKEMSARTGGLILVQLLLDLSRAGERADRVLDAPTSDAWIAPWVTYLRVARRDVRLGDAGRGADRARRADRGATVGGRDGHRRLLRRRAAGGGHAHAALARAAARRSRA